MSESTYNDIFYQRGEYAVTEGAMSEGERVERWVYERMPDGEVPGVWTYLGAEYICDASNAQSHVFYRRIPDPVPALQARIAELEGALDSYRNAANYWYMVCKQDRGQTVTRWSSNDADDRAINEAATERQVSRQRLDLLGSLLDQWDQLPGDVKSELSADAPTFVQAIRAIQKIDALGGDK